MSRRSNIAAKRHRIMARASPSTPTQMTTVPADTDSSTTRPTK